MDLYIISAVAILGLLDVYLERKTGRGLIARVEDYVSRLQAGGEGK